MKIGKLAKLEKARGEPLAKIIPPAIEKTGSIWQAALDLGVTPSAINYWLANNGLEVVREVKVQRKAVPLGE